MNEKEGEYIHHSSQQKSRLKSQFFMFDENRKLNYFLILKFLSHGEEEEEVQTTSTSCSMVLPGCATTWDLIIDNSYINFICLNFKIKYSNAKDVTRE